MPDAAVAVVTGANSGIGRATALWLAREGFVVHGTVRDVARAGKLLDFAARDGLQVHVSTVDVGDDESVRVGFEQILCASDRVDVLVNCAGIGGVGTLEDSTCREYLDLINVNLCGAVRCTQAVLPGMRSRRSGTIVNVTSIAGRVALLAQSSYVASKFALEGVTEGLAQELAPFGIRVVIVEPGVTKSAMFAKHTSVPERSGAYDAHYRRLFEFYARAIPQATDASVIAEAIHHAIVTDEPTLRNEVGWGAVEMLGARKTMTDREWIALGAHEDDADYFHAFLDCFRLGDTPPPDAEFSPPG